MVDVTDAPFPRVEGRRCHERLKGRSRFINVDDGSVPIRFFIALAIMIQIISRTTGHGQNFTGLGVHDDDGGPFRFIAVHDTVQFFFSQILNRTVDGKADRPFFIGQELLQGRFKDRNVITIGLKAEVCLLPRISSSRIISIPSRPRSLSPTNPMTSAAIEPLG